jgi:hypothetical protein
MGESQSCFADPETLREGRSSEGRKSDGSGLSACECAGGCGCRFGPIRPAMELSRCQRLGRGAAMTDERRVRIGLRHIRALKLGGTIWDIVVPGFGARRQPSDAVYFVCYRTLEGRHADSRGASWTGTVTEFLGPAGSVSLIAKSVAGAGQENPHRPGRCPPAGVFAPAFTSAA